MSLTKQAKILNKSQIDMVRQFLRNGRNGLRNELMLMLSAKAGLRAKEIAALKWIYLIDSDSNISDQIHLPNIAAKGNSGRVIPINKELGDLLKKTYDLHRSKSSFDINTSFVITTERCKSTTAQTVVNFFQSTYQRLGLIGCSSHSGRRTFITNVARKISTVGGSMRDVQTLAGHSSLQTTQRYVDSCVESKMKVVNLI